MSGIHEQEALPLCRYTIFDRPVELDHCEGIELAILLEGMLEFATLGFVLRGYHLFPGKLSYVSTLDLKSGITEFRNKDRQNMFDGVGSTELGIEVVIPEYREEIEEPRKVAPKQSPMLRKAPGSGRRMASSSIWTGSPSARRRPTMQTGGASATDLRWGSSLQPLTTICPPRDSA